MYKVTINSKITLFVLLLGTMSGFYSCSNNSVSTQADNLEVSVLSSRNITDMDSSIELDTAKILIKDIKLNGSGKSDSSNFKVGPYVFYLNFTTIVTSVGSAFIPAGNYDKMIFDIHKLADDETPPDPDFLDANGRYSTVVKGRFNGVPFVFKSDKSCHQKINFPTSVPLTTAARTNVTFFAQPYIWFYKNGVVMDPNDPANRNDIEDNIRDNINHNFKAFKDNDKNGIPDLN